MRPQSLLRMLAVTAITAGCTRSAPPDSGMVTEWMRLLFGAVRVERISPPVASRIYAYGAVAMYSGLAATDPSMEPLTGKLNEFPALPVGAGGGYDRSIVAVMAERTTLDSLMSDALPTTRAAIGQLADSLIAARGASTATRERSEDLGRRIAYALVAWSHGDGFDSTRGRPYKLPTGPGLWVNDSPANWYAIQNPSGISQSVTFDNPANRSSSGNTSDRDLILSRPKSSSTLPPVNMAGVAEPYWGWMRPFALKRWDDCQAPVPPPFSDKPGSPIYREAMEVVDVKKNLTPEQRMTALYWADNPVESATPAGHWLSIGAELIGQRNLSAEDAARVMLLTSLSVADGFIVVWRYKFTHNLIRPRTFIRQTIDPDWEPAIPTPPFPEYMAGHSAISAAAGAALIATIGNVPFDDSTHVNLGHPVRHFPSIQAAAIEAGMSRLYGGIHYPSGITVGRTVGECVGNAVVQHLGPAAKMTTR